MITSIVPIPEYAAIGTPIYGERYGGIYDLTPESIDELQVSGRRLEILPNMHKYKIQLQDYVTGRTYTIVFIAAQKFDPFAGPKPDLSIPIYPIYLREYPLNGAQSPLRSNCILWIPGINRLFDHIMMPQVTSIVEAFKYMMNYVQNDSLSHIPERILDEKYDPRCATLAPVPCNIGMAFLTGDGDSARIELETCADYTCIPFGYLSKNVTQILKSQQLGDIWKLVDDRHASSLISQAVRTTLQDWEVYYEWIHKTDDSCPRYVTEDRAGEMCNVLYYSSLFNTIDFSFRCEPPMRTNTGGTLFNTTNWDTTGHFDYNKLSQFGDTIRAEVNMGFEWNSESYVTAVGSYLEDISVYNREGELIAYIDLVWWILAHAGGLLNSKSIYI